MSANMTLNYKMGAIITMKYNLESVKDKDQKLLISDVKNPK